MEQHARIWVAGVEWSDYTIAALEISGGRSDRMSNPDVATVRCTVVLPADTDPPNLGARVDIKGWLCAYVNRFGQVAGESNSSVALFSGVITDVAIEGDVLTFLAADLSVALQGLVIGDDPWPVEAWAERMEHIWTALRAEAGDPSWMPVWADMWSQFFLFAFNDWQAARDVDRQAGLDLLYEYMAPYGVAIYFVPSFVWSGDVGDPSTWQPTMRIRSSLEAHPGASDPATKVWDDITLGDPPPRVWRNKTTYANTWRVRHLDNTTDPYGEPEAVATDPDSRAKYGPREGAWSTELLAEFSGTPVTAAQELADAWLARTRIPLFHVDPLTVVFTPSTMEPLASDQNWWDSWTALMAHGPAQVGRRFRFQLQAGAPLVESFVESMTVRHVDDGWEVDLSLSPVSAYTGLMGSTIRGSIPSQTYSPGVWPTIIGLYVTRSDDLERLPYGTVTYDGQVYPVDEHGNVPPMPMQALSLGANTLSMVYAPPAGSEVAGSTTTFTVTRITDVAEWTDAWRDAW